MMRMMYKWGVELAEDSGLDHPAPVLPEARDSLEEVLVARQEEDAVVLEIFVS